MEIIINNMQKIIALDDYFKEMLRRIVTECLNSIETIDDKGEVGITLVDDDFIAELNKKYRGRSGPTDVLAFPLNEEGMIGDIIISIEQANKQAKEEGHSLLYEIGFLTAHGALHLAGYEHETDESERDMHAKTGEILRKYKL